MPLFSKKFDVKPIPARGKRNGVDCPPIQEKIDDIDNISLYLGKQQAKFVDGSWILSSNGSNADDFVAVKRKMQKLEEENNLNRIKIDVLLDMLTENLAEVNVLRRNSEK